MNPLTPLPFTDVQALHKELGGGMTLPEFAKEANRLTSSELFNSGVGNPFSIGIKQASAGLDRFIDKYAGPVDETLGDWGAWAFDKLGADEEFGRQVGEGMLRDFVDYVPAMAGYALSPVTGGASIPVGLAATAAMSGANAYEKTDSELMGLTSAALAGFGGKMTEFGATTALRGAAKIPGLKALGIEGGKKVLTTQGDDIIEQLIAKKAGDRVLGAVAGESFVNVAGMLNEAGVGLVETGEWNNPFTRENLLAEMLDPTVLFGVKELVSPSVISQKVVKQANEIKQFTTAQDEEAAKRVAGDAPTIVGKTVADIEDHYRELYWKVNKIEDKDQREATLTQLKGIHAEARKHVREAGAFDVPTLFGEAMHTKLGEEFQKPATKKEVDPTGQVVEAPLMLRDVLKPEEFRFYNENLRHSLTPESMLRLTEVREIDTPKTLDEYRDSVVKMNAVRAELDRGEVDDAWFRRNIDTFEREGDTVEVASEKAWTVAKNETEAAVEAAAKYPLAIAGQGREGESLARGVVQPKSATVIERPSQTETDPDIVKAKEAVEDVDDEGWTPTDFSKLAPVREVPGSAGGVLGRLKAKEATMKRPKGKRVNPLLSATDEGVTIKETELDRFNKQLEEEYGDLEARQDEVDKWVKDEAGFDDDDEIAFFGEDKVNAFSDSAPLPKNWEYPKKLTEYEAEVEQIINERKFKEKLRSVYSSGKEPQYHLTSDSNYATTVYDPQTDQFHRIKIKQITGAVRPDGKEKYQGKYEVENGPDYFGVFDTIEDAQRAVTVWNHELNRAHTTSRLILDNGKESKLFASLTRWADNEEEALRLYAGVHTKRFKEWFGDWETADNRKEYKPTLLTTDEVIRRIESSIDEFEFDLRTAADGSKWLAVIYPEGETITKLVNGQVDLAVLRTGLMEDLGEGAVDFASFNELFPELPKSEESESGVSRASTNVSQAVDENGEPLLLFRGGTYFKDELDPKELGVNTNAPSAKEGWFFSDKFDNSKTYVRRGEKKLVTQDLSPTELEAKFRELALGQDQTYDLRWVIDELLRDTYDADIQLKGFKLEARVELDKLAQEIYSLPEEQAVEKLRSFLQKILDYKGKPVPTQLYKVVHSAEEIDPRLPFYIADKKNGFFNAVSTQNGEILATTGTLDDAISVVEKTAQAQQRWTSVIGTAVNRIKNNPARWEDFFYLNKLDEAGITKETVKSPSGEVMPFFLNIRNLAEESDHGSTYREESYYNRMMKAFRDDSRDGLVIRDTYDPKHNDVWIVPKGSEHQIKHAVNNTGAFARSNKFAEFPGDSPRAFEAERVATRDELFTRIMRKHGVMNNKAIERSREAFNKLFDLFDGDDVKLFEILDGSVRGAATLKGATRKLFLGDKGLEGLSDEARGYATTFVAAHELAHNSEQLYNEGLLNQRHWDMFDQMKRWSDDASPAERKLVLEIMADAWVGKKHRNSEVVQLALNALDDAKEFRANIMSMWAMGQVNKPDGFALNLLPSPIRKGIQVLSDLYHAAVASFRGLSSFDLMFKDRQKARKQLDSMSKMMKTWKKELNKSEEFFTEAAGLAQVGPQSYRDVLAYFGKKDDIDRKSVLPYDDRGVLTKVFDEWILPFDQLTQMVPQFRGIAADLHNYTGDTRAALNRIAGMIAGEITPNGKIQFSDRTKEMQWKMVKDNPRLSKVASDWMRAQQTVDNPLGGKGLKLSFEDLKTKAPEVHATLTKLNEKERTAVINIVHRMGTAMQKLQSEALQVLNASNTAMVTSYIANKTPELRKDAPGISQLLFRGLKDIRSADPATHQAGNIMLAQAASKLGPEQFQKVYDIALKAADSYDKIDAQFRMSPHFFSEMRFGKYFIHWTRPDGTTGGLAFDSLQDARAKEKALRDSGASVTLEETRRGSARIVGRDQLLDRLEEFDKRGKALVDELDLDDETKQLLKNEFNVRWEFLRDVNAAKIIEPGSKRHLAEGREDLDMIQTQMLYFQVAMRSLNKKLLNHRLNYRFSDPELKDPKVAAYRPQLKQMIKNFFTPDTEVGRGLATFNAGYFLGGNLSSHLIELMQPGFSFVPELINRQVGFVEANRMTLKAMTEVGMFTMKHIPSAFGRMVKRKLPQGRQAPQNVLEGMDDNTLWDNAEYAQLMDYAANRGAISLGYASDTMDVDVENNVDITGMMGTRGKESAFKRFGVTPVMNFVRFPLKFYQQFTEFNARVSLILGYELAKKQGVSKQQAIEDALEFSKVVTFSGGKLNRPNQMFSGEGTYRTIGQGLYSLQGYTFGMLGMMRRYAEVGYSGKQFPGLTADQRKAARKSLKTMIATQFLGAGAMGMPFVQAGMLMLEKLTGIELEREMREGLAELFEEDEQEDDGLLSDAVMHGAANAILGNMLPGDPDLGSRFSIGGVMGISSYEGYSLPQLFGPTSSVIQNVVNGVKSASAGDYGLAMQDLAPVAAKKIIDLVRNEGELRDRNGGKLIDATYGEKVAYAVGMSPQRVKKMRTRERLQAKHEEKLRNDMIRRIDQLTDLYQDGQMPTLLNELHKIALEDPEVDIARKLGDPNRYQVELQASKRRAAEKIVDRLEKRMYPRDSGSKGTLRGSYGEAIPGAGPGEQNRLMLKARVEQDLGLMPSINQRAVRRAALIDSLRQKNSKLSRPEAAALADQLLARS